MFEHPPIPLPDPRRKRNRNIVIGIAVAVLSCCIGGSLLAAFAGVPAPQAAPTTAVYDNPMPSWPEPAPAASDAPTATKAAAPPALPTTIEEGIWHVGEDLAPGTYRVIEAVDSDEWWCYWSRTKDAESKRLIANDLVTGGRPQVTLKKGEWFTTRGCPLWKRR